MGIRRIAKSHEGRRGGRRPRSRGDRESESYSRRRAVVLAPSPAYKDVTWKSAYEIDPFTIPVEQKADLLIKANTEAMKVAGVKFVNSVLIFFREDRNYANTDGSMINRPSFAAGHRLP
jgi:TldD protein